MNRMDAEIPIDIDPRYKSMLNKIAEMLNRNNAAGLDNYLSFHLVIFSTILFYFKSIVN